MKFIAYGTGDDGGMNAATIIKTASCQGTFQLIGATNDD